AGCRQARQRRDDEALDGALEVTRAVTQLDALAQQELLGRLGDGEVEALAATFVDALLHAVQLKVEDVAQLFVPQAAEDHGLVYAVHELRRKLAPRRVERRAIDLLIEIAFDHLFALRRRK